MKTLHYLGCLSLGSLLLVLAGTAAAQQAYPTRPVRIVVGFPAGGPPDVLARLLGPRMAERFGQQFVVENRVGASVMIGADAVAKAPPDGHTLLVSDVGALVIGPHVQKAPYDTARDFSPAGLVGMFYHVISVHPSLPVKTIKELVALAKKRPGEINYASSGTGSNLALMGEMLQNATDIKMTHVPYKGSAPAIIALVGGEAQMMFSGIITILPYLPTKRLVPLAVTSATRSALLPDVPTLVEAGIQGVEVPAWLAMMAPAGTPRDVIAKLNAEVARISALSDYRQQLQQQAIEPTVTKPEEFPAFLKVEQEKWGRAVKAAGLKPN